MPLKSDLSKPLFSCHGRNINLITDIAKSRLDKSLFLIQVNAAFARVPFLNQESRFASQSIRVLLAVFYISFILIKKINFKC